jgi:hypothetical protein
LSRNSPARFAVLALLTVACDPTVTEAPQGSSTAAPVGNEPTIETAELVDVLPRDAIPSIDQPRFISPQETTWLAGREPVVALEIEGDARAYPAQIMTRHEIVNDRVGGRPVAVTYCPLCNSALVFERTVGGRVLEFGVSGKLYRSALVMYDRQTESLWTQFGGVAFEGPLEGSDLESVPVQLLSFDEWRRSHPAGSVLSRRTGFDVDYGTNPYEGYDRREGPYDSFFGMAIDDRLPAMHRVVGVPAGKVAYAYRDLANPDAGSGVLMDHRRDLVVFWQAGTASALDTSRIAEGRDVGATGVFSPVAGGRELTFAPVGDGFRDAETGSTWSLAGMALSGPLEGARLRPIEHLDTFWFAWAAYYPDTEIYATEGGA